MISTFIPKNKQSYNKKFRETMEERTKKNYCLLEIVVTFAYLLI